MRPSLIAGCLLTVLGCEESRPSLPSPKAIGEAIEREAAEIRQRYSVQLADMDSQINELQVKVGDATGDVRAKLQNQLGTLRRMRDGLAARLEELRERGADTWRSAKPKLDDAFDDLKNAVQRMKEQTR